ncbi:hypothetical protein HPB50_013844 [Hyalomma asiaticum]|uniref:Uncharacterized protein n=1 Tax=Hyalomma asiaticum TaxID=266040 RepID=A0ACB7RTI1_HYAAI|nr:hypothetical protein HPB50_013844 [Hyalomma asiaticum]
MTVPPRTSLLTFVMCDAFDGCKGVAEADIPLVLERNIYSVRSLVQLQNGCSLGLLRNFGKEHQHVPQATVVAFL